MTKLRKPKTFRDGSATISDAGDVMFWSGKSYDTKDLADLIQWLQRFLEWKTQRVTK